MHDLWHETLGAYPDADEFVLKLNACIQAGRTVTFVLQKELKRTEWFADWYEPWRDRMRADERMSWLVKARNRIEKEGDLETASIALVSLLVTDGEHAVSRLEVPPLAGPADIAARLSVPELPERVRRQAVLAVERRWTVPELSDGELLEVLAYCYGFLAQLLVEAHERYGVAMQTFGGETHQGRHARAPHPSGRLACMLPTAEARTAYWHMGTETLMEYGVRSTNVISEDPPDRYMFGDLRNRLMPKHPLRYRGKFFHEIGRRILQADGFHHTLAWLFDGEKHHVTLGLNFDDQQDKVVKVRHLANEVERTGANMVLIAGEVWSANEVQPDDPRFMLRAGERQDRSEIFVTYVLSPEERFVFYTPFDRDGEGKPALRPIEEEVEGFTGKPLFQPVFAVWDRWARDHPEGTDAVEP
jgi:hypothetical protein